ncbi:hypothetical protein VHEMI05053 [[Torrubiella] hemipterigena]|uniref:Rhodanese domain-containing protein n=1 Tax=[Torrubiella] hemipterigena TaxID=1531966 RepID=A0A0A1SX15_9HYPO|nr:hypothetical protein VHEMI05053 [[Torrubiella] hemipterigena]
MAATPQTDTARPWYASLPEPKAECGALDNVEVMKMLEATTSGDQKAARKYLLVDVRRNDWEGGTIATSINLPAQSLYQTRPIIYQLCQQAGIEQVLFYCGSSTGRGTRCARWMQDYINEVGDTKMKAAIVRGGIKGWQKSFGAKMIEGYEERVWKDKAQ